MDRVLFLKPWFPSLCITKMASLIFVFLLALSIFLLLILLQKHKIKGKACLPLPPGPPGLPFIGNLHQLDASSPHLHLWQLSKQYGPLLSLRLGSVQTLVVSSAKMAKEVMKTHDLAFSSRPNFISQQKLSYNGLDVVFAPYNLYWREMKKLCIVKLLNLKRVQSFCSIREDEVSRLVAKVSKLASSSKPVNLSEVVMALTSNIIFRIAFGKRYEEEGCEMSRFHGLMNEAQAIFTRFFVSDYFPFLGWIDRITGQMGCLERIFKGLDDFYQEIIDDHLDTKGPKHEEENITDVLLQTWKDSSFSMDITWDHIKAVLMNIFIGGTDTSAVAVIWAMTQLLKNPRVMKKVQQEIRDLIGKKGFVHETDLQNLPYLKAVVKESMRLHPPVPLLVPRETTQMCNIDGYQIPPKSLVYVNAWAIGRDPEAWENPEEFFPERFMGSCVDFNGLNFEFIPFGGGRRSCPGLYLGAMNVELALANLVYSFDWEMPVGMKKEDIDIEVIPGIALHKKNALCLMARNYI